MAKFTSIAFDEILVLSEKQTVTKQDFDRIKELYPEILINEQEKYAWILEGIWVSSNGKLN